MDNSLADATDQGPPAKKPRQNILSKAFSLILAVIKVKGSKKWCEKLLTEEKFVIIGDPKIQWTMNRKHLFRNMQSAGVQPQQQSPPKSVGQRIKVCFSF